MTAEPSREVVSRDQRRTELAALTFNPKQMFQPRDGRELMDMANLMSTAGLMVKDIYRNNPGACMGLIAVCAPYGLNPLQVSWKTFRASKADDAPIAYEAQVIVAMANASGAVVGSLRYDYSGDGQNRKCRCYATLRGDSEPVEIWTPPLAQINPKNSPLWKTDPDQQLAYYAGRSWVRRYRPEMLLGIYDVDEISGPQIGPDAARDITPAAPRRGGVVYQTIAPAAPAQANEVIDGAASHDEETEPQATEAAAPALSEAAAKLIARLERKGDAVELTALWASQTFGDDVDRLSDADRVAVTAAYDAMFTKLDGAAE